MKRNSAAALAAIALAALMAGCRVEKTTHGDSKDVTISTPFGGMHVKTNNADVLASIGLPAYPGAEEVPDTGDDNKSADVDMSFGNFQLRVKKVGYRTDDAPDKVEAFYRKVLHRFGDVIACRNDHTAGGPERTAEGLTCDYGHDRHFNVNVNTYEGHGELELKAGSQHRQHIVEIEPDGGGTKFALVALDLPLTSEDQGQ